MPEEEQRGEVVELFQREIQEASLDDSKPLTEAVAGLRQRCKELDVSIDQLPDSFIEAVISTMRRLQSMPRVEQEIEIYGRPLDEIANEATASEETTSEEAKTA